MGEVGAHGLFWHYPTECLGSNPNSSHNSVDIAEPRAVPGRCNSYRSQQSDRAVNLIEVLRPIELSFRGLWIPLSSR